MGLNRVRVDSVAKLQKKKTMAELQEENEALKTKVSSLETNLDNIGFTDKACNKTVFRLIVDVCRRTDLLNLTVIHNNNRI